MHVILFFKSNDILLPELLGVAWTPSQLATLYLVSKFIYGTEFFLIFIEILEKWLKHLIDVLVDPVAVLEFDDKLVGIDVG